MKIYIVRTNWAINPYDQPTTTKAFRTKEAMCKTYENLCNARNRNYHFYHFECQINSKLPIIDVYYIDDKTKKKEKWSAWGVFFEEIELEN